LGEMGDALSRPIAELMSHPVLALDCRTRLGDAALYFKSKSIRHCLVVDDSGRPLGMLSQTDLVMNQGAEYFLRLRPIHSVKVPPPVIVDPEEKLAAVMRVMRLGGLSAVVVRFPDDEYGILTERDVVRLAAANALDGIVSDHASRRLHSLAHSNSLYSARKFLSDHRLRHVGVLDDQGELTGLLSLSDILCGIEHEYVHELRTALHERDE
ncbi:MAG TPA: diguanylate cyclase, partial [Cupriavidus sp.]|nr:diguanylate cyclase [Cupriavidus sp.]